MSEHVRVEKEGPVLAITLARPERRNAITVAMYEALHMRVIVAYLHDPEICFVGDVVLEHIKDELFLNGLPH